MVSRKGAEGQVPGSDHESSRKTNYVFHGVEDASIRHPPRIGKTHQRKLPDRTIAKWCSKRGA